MPNYKVLVGGETYYALNDKELAKILKEHEEAQYLEIFEREELKIIEARLNKLGVSMEHYMKPTMVKEEIEVRGATKKKVSKKKVAKTSTKKEAVLKPLFLISEEKDKHEFFSLQGVLEYVRVQANKGVYIQRYKGLGEMNPTQLWETTMDPARRTLLQVALEDAVEVDKTFTMLMGDQVAPRREFIEANAHEVKNLDV